MVYLLASERRLETGGGFISGMTASDAQRGEGRELSDFGIREFVNVQTIWVGPATGAPRVPSAPAVE